MARGDGMHSVRRSVRGVARRAADAAVEHYRIAVGEHSRALPAYLRVADVAALALRARNSVGRPGRPPVSRLPEPEVPAVSAAAISNAGELSFVLTGAAAWRRTIHAVALHPRDRSHPTGSGAGIDTGDTDREGLVLRSVLQTAAGVIRVNAVLPADPELADRQVVLADYDVVLVDSDGEALDLPTPDLRDLRAVAGG